MNAVRPGMVLTEMTEKQLADATFRNHIEVVDPDGSRRQGRRNRRRGIVAFVRRGAFITGAMLDAAGGESISEICRLGRLPQAAMMIMLPELVFSFVVRRYLVPD